MHTGKIGLFIKLGLSAIFISILAYGLYTVYAYRFTDEDRSQMSQSAVEANEFSEQLTSSIEQSVPVDGEVLALNGSQAGAEAECSDVIYNDKQGTKSIFCSQAFVYFIGFDTADFPAAKDKVVNQLTADLERSPESNGSTYYHWPLGRSGNTQAKVTIKVAARANDETDRYLSPEVKGLLQKHPYVMDISYQHVYYEERKPRNLFEYLK